MRSLARSPSAANNSWSLWRKRKAPDAAIMARERGASFNVSPDERFGPHLGRRRGRAAIRGIAALAVLGLGWAQFDGRFDALGWLSSISTTVTSAVAPLFERSPSRTSEATKPVLTPIVAPAGTEQAARSARLAPDNASAAPPPPGSPPAILNAAPATPAAPAEATAPQTAGISAAYAPPAPAPADPNQARATAAGLHSELSRVLLARLSTDDFRNAKAAIDTALAETADDDALVWPRQRKAEQALFKVHFVPGAASDCRRYVVTIAKDGWSTTALPMERCGVQRKAPPRK